MKKSKSYRESVALAQSLSADFEPRRTHTHALSASLFILLQSCLILKPFRYDITRKFVLRMMFAHEESEG